MKVFELLEGVTMSEDDDDIVKLQKWKEQVKKAYPEHAKKMKFKGYSEKGKNTVCAEVPGMDRCFGVFDMDKLKGEVLGEEVVMERRPVGAPKWHDSDAPDAKGKFKELGVNDLADWLIKTRGGDMQKINGSLQQQIVFNRKKNPTYAKKMESVRVAVKRKLAAKKKD